MTDHARFHPVVPYISLCSGYEGIGLGLHRAIRGLRAIAYCEREAFACANLAAKIEAGLLDAAPVFTDVSDFPWLDFAPFMAGGILSFGWPCQPVSCAGARKATEDERWLFDIICDGIALMRPGFIFAENVEGLLSAKMPDGSLVVGHCITRLEKLGYDLKAGIFSAAERGAPHLRKRVFILGELANNNRGGCSEDQQSPELRTTCLSQSSDGPRLFSPEREAFEISLWPSRPGESQYEWEPPRTLVADRKRIRQSQREGGIGEERRRPLNGGKVMADCDDRQRDRQEQELCAGRHAVVEGGQTVGHPSNRDGLGEAQGQSGYPAQSDQSLADTESAERQLPGNSRQWRSGLTDECEELAQSRRDNGIARGIATSREASSGRPRAEAGGSDPFVDWSPKSPLGRDADEPADRMDAPELYGSVDNRTDELRLLGNGVVSCQAEFAFRTLYLKLRLAFLE